VVENVICTIDSIKSNTLYLDYREPDKISRLLEKQGIPFVLANLPTGDFVYNNWVFERKAIADLWGSIISGRIFNQIENMKANFENVVIIISGSNKEAYFSMKNFNENVINGAIASFIVKQQIQVLRVDNDSQLIKMIKLIIDKSTEAGVVNTFKIRKMSDEDVYMSMLCCIPNVGVNKAESVLMKYKFRDLFNLSIGELKEVEGIGNKIAESIKKYL